MLDSLIFEMTPELVGRQCRPVVSAQPPACWTEIARLAAAGLSNKEIGGRLFLSQRTVGSHLYQIFPKLGISSRAALRDALAGYDADT